MARNEFSGTAACADEQQTARAGLNTDAGAKSEDSRGLSARENEVMHWVKMGKTNQEIACILEISAFTVKNHLQRIFRKLEALNRTHAVARYERMEQDVRS